MSSDRGKRPNKNRANNYLILKKKIVPLILKNSYKTSILRKDDFVP